MDNQAIQDLKKDEIYSLDLKGMKVDDGGIIKLSELLKTNKSLQILDLGDNNITDIGAKYLLNALKLNCNLTCINVEGNDISPENKNSIYNLMLNKIEINTIEITDDHNLSYTYKGETKDNMPDGAGKKYNSKGELVWDGLWA